MTEPKDDILANLRAIIISSKGGLKISDIKVDYKETFGVEIPLKTLGCSTLEEFFKNNPQNFTIVGGRVQAVTKTSSLHIASLVSKQRTAKKRGRSKLFSKEIQRLRKPKRPTTENSFNIHAKKPNPNVISKPLKQNSKEALTAHLKQLQIQQVAVSNKSAESGILKPSSKLESEEKNQNGGNQIKNSSYKNLTRTVKNDLTPPTKDIGHNNLIGIPVPFEDFEEFNKTKVFESPSLSKNTVNNSGSFAYNNFYDNLNRKMGFNLSSNSPFQRSLANNSQNEILSAKRTANTHQITNNGNRLLSATNIAEPIFDVDDDGYEQKLKQFCREKGLIMPTYSLVIRESSNRSKFYGCKLNIGDGFHLSTYPIETRSETSARELVSKKAYNQLSSNNNLPSFFYDTEHVIKLINFCSKNDLPEPIFKSIECHPKNEPRYFICKVRIGKDTLLSSYPVESSDEFSARDLVAKKAYEFLSPGNKSRAGIPKDDNVTISRIFEIIKTKDYGVWCNKMRNLYVDTYNEELQTDWFKLVEKCPKFEITNIAKVGYIIRAKNREEMGKDFSGSFELAALKVPESNQWEVYITNVVTSAEVWCRLIGKDFSEVYDSMMTKLELHPPTLNVVSPTVGEIYLVNLEESWNRVKIVEIFSEKMEVSVFLIDIGVDEVVKTSQLFYLQHEFFSVPPQAILLSLNELDCLAECEELQIALFHSLLGNTFIAEVVAILDEGVNVSSVNLWDTSTEEDINVNLKLLDDVTKTLKSPALPTIGIVEEMYVSHIDDNGDVYLQASRQNSTFLERIISIKMKNSGSLISANNKKIDSKKLYVARSTKTGLFCRAKLIKPLDSKLVLVKFIDYGYEQETPLDDLLDLEQTYFELATIPSQAIRAKFACSKPLSSRAVSKIRDLVSDQSVLVKVTHITIGSPPLVELLKRSNIDGTLSSVNKIINDDVVQVMDTPTRKKSYIVSLENTLSRNLPMPNIPPVGSYFNVFVTLAAHPGLFNVQPLTTQNELMELMFRLQKKCEQSYSKALSPDDFKIGELYAVKHSDDFWYRAYAQAITGSSTFIVCLCDFGDFIETSPEKLMPLSGEFKTFPYQAIRAYLAGIAPINKDWPALDCVHFRELVVDKQFVSQIIEINRDVKNPNYISLGLLLVDTSTSEDVYIHKLLVEKKMATLKTREL